MYRDGGGCDPGEDEGAGSVGKDCGRLTIMQASRIRRDWAYAVLQTAASILEATLRLDYGMRLIL